jgi:DNA polymerase-3 subunit beta
MTHTFTIEQAHLISLLSSMQPICSKRTTLDATSYILFQAGHKELVLKGTDLEISLQASCPMIESTLDEQQAFLVSGKRLFDLVKELEGPIEFTVTTTQLGMRAHNVEVSLHIKDAQEFPPFPERIENLMQIESPHLLELLNKVAFIIPQNNSNIALNGLLLEINNDGMTMTATDGHCLAHAHTVRYTLGQPQKWLIPRRAIFEIKKLLELCKGETTTAQNTIFLGICNNQLVVSGGSFNFFTRLLAATFPECRAILDTTGFQCATIDKTHLTRALRRSACLLSGQFIATHFDFEKESVRLSMNNTEAGKLQETLSLVEFKGDPLGIKFYAPYVLNGLQAFSDNMVSFYIKSSTKPIVFHNADAQQTITYLVMPVSPSNTRAA